MVPAQVLMAAGRPAAGAAARGAGSAATRAALSRVLGGMSSMGFGNALGLFFALTSIPGLLQSLGLFGDDTKEMEGRALGMGSLPGNMAQAQEAGADLFGQKLLANDLPSIGNRVTTPSYGFDNEKLLMEFLAPQAPKLAEFSQVMAPQNAPVGMDADPFGRTLSRVMG